MSANTWERVHTINSYYDGPQLGVADFCGQPHIYERQFDRDEDEYADRFLLSAVDPELFLLLMEDWEIWQRWDAAYRQGQVTIETHPALPEERQRHSELSKLIGDRLKPDSQRCFSKWARFRYGEGQTEVQWLDSPAERS